MIALLIPFAASSQGLPVDPGARCRTLSAPALAKWVQSTPSLQGEVVLVDDSAREENVRALALALHADRTPLGGAWRIFRRDETSRELAKADAAWMRESAKATVGRLRKRWAGHEDFSPERPYEALREAKARFDALASDSLLDTSGSAAAEATPSARLLASLLDSMPEASLRQARPGEATVFSSQPIGTEKPLGPLGPVLSIYESEQARFAGWCAEAAAQGRVPAPYRWAFPGATFRPGKRTVLLTISREEAEPRFSLAVYDQGGRCEAGVVLSAREPEDLGLPVSSTVRLGRVPLSEATWGHETSTRGERSRWPGPTRRRTARPSGPRGASRVGQGERVREGGRLRARRSSREHREVRGRSDARSRPGDGCPRPFRVRDDR